MKALLPIILMLIGVGAGSGAGLLLKPEEEVSCDEASCEEVEAEAQDKTLGEDGDQFDYLRLQNQFVVPVVRDELVSSLVVLSLSLEITPGSEDAVYEREPKLRDTLLRILFDHAFIGGFDGTFTESSRLVALRVALLEGAQSVLGSTVTDILITDIARQEM